MDSLATSTSVMYDHEVELDDLSSYISNKVNDYMNHSYFNDQCEALSKMLHVKDPSILREQIKQNCYNCCSSTTLNSVTEEELDASSHKRQSRKFLVVGIVHNMNSILDNPDLALTLELGEIRSAISAILAEVRVHNWEVGKNDRKGSPDATDDVVLEKYILSSLARWFHE